MRLTKLRNSNEKGGSLVNKAELEILVLTAISHGESGTLDFDIEFKKSFASTGKILKTMAGMANNKGGNIVFGVIDETNAIEGLDQDNLTAFDMQHNRFPQAVQEYFSPQIAWEHNIVEIKGKTVGIINIKENIHKPVIATKNGMEVIKSGEIYYRYKSETTVIKPSELTEIIESEREQVRKTTDEKWRSLFSKIALYGIDNAGVIDPTLGTIYGSTHRFILDEKLFGKLRQEFNFIKKGEFDEVTGEKTLNVVGEISITDNLPTIVKKQGRVILPKECIQIFLKQSVDLDPIEYIKTYVNESLICPLFYYAYLSKKNYKEICAIVENVENKKITKKKKAKEVLSQKDIKGQKNLEFGSLESIPEKSKQLMRQKETLLKGDFTYYNSFEKDKELLETIFTLTDKDAEKIKGGLFLFLDKLIEQHFVSSEYKLLPQLKSAIIYLDELLYKPKWQNEYSQLKWNRKE